MDGPSLCSHKAAPLGVCVPISSYRDTRQIVLRPALVASMLLNPLSKDPISKCSYSLRHQKLGFGLGGHSSALCEAYAGTAVNTRPSASNDSLVLAMAGPAGTPAHAQ